MMRWVAIVEGTKAMRLRQGGSTGAGRAGAGLMLVLLAGCGQIPGLDRALLADRNPAAHHSDLASHYVVHCPDVLDFRINDGLAWGGERTVGTDGRIYIDRQTTCRVDGLTTTEIEKIIAARLGRPTGCVHVQVGSFNSQQLYLFGEVKESQQVVPYHGPETVLDLLQRVGGTIPGAAPRDVQVVRAHVADGKAPEVFHVDLAAIVLHEDQKTNVTLLPFDKVYVGQSPQSRRGKCLPPWLRRLHDSFWNMQRKDEQTGE